MSLEQYIGVGILLERPHVNLDADLLAGFEGSGDERTAAGSDDSHHNPTVRIGGGLTLLDPIVEGAGNGPFVPSILDGVFLKDLVRDAFQIDGQGLEGCLKIVLVSGAENGESIWNRLLVLQITHV